MDDIKKAIRYFFNFTCNMPELSEKLLCSGSYSFVGDRINARIMEHRAKTNRGAFSKDRLEDHLVFAYFASVSIILYRQWVKDEKEMPVEELIRIVENLICRGLEAYVQ